MERLRDYIRGGQVHRLRDEAQAGREPLPPGEYTLELTDAVLVEDHDTDCLDLVWRVAIGSGEHAGRRIYQRLRLYGASWSYSIAALDLIGIPVGSLDSRALPRLEPDPRRPGERFRATAPVGIVVVAKVGHWQGDDGRPRHQVERLLRVARPAPDLRGLGLALAPPVDGAGGSTDDGAGADDEDIPF